MDISDIETTIVSTLLDALTASPSLPGAVVPSSLNGAPQLRIGRGWPSSDELQTDLDNNVSRVSVFPLPGMTRILPTRMRQWKQLTANIPTIVLTTVGQTVTLSGSISSGQVCGISFTSPYGPSLGYAYRLDGTETLSIIATALATAIPGASANGAAVTLPGAYSGVSGSAVADQVSVQELRHQSQDLLVTIWTNSPSLRDSVASTVDLTLAEVDRLNIDGISAGPVLYRSSKTIDANEAQKLWRRDLTYTITYPTVQRQIQPSILFPWMAINPSNSLGSLGGGIVKGPSDPNFVTFIETLTIVPFTLPTDDLTIILGIVGGTLNLPSLPISTGDDVAMLFGIVGGTLNQLPTVSGDDLAMMMGIVGGTLVVSSGNDAALLLSIV